MKDKTFYDVKAIKCDYTTRWECILYEQKRTLEGKIKFEGAKIEADFLYIEPMIVRKNIELDDEGLIFIPLKFNNKCVLKEEDFLGELHDIFKCTERE